MAYLLHKLTATLSYGYCRPNARGGLTRSVMNPPNPEPAEGVSACVVTRGAWQPWLPGFRAWLVLGPASGSRVVGAQPPAPWPTCGEDPGDDDLGCVEFPPCADARPVILGDANCDGVVDQDDGEMIRDHVTMGLELCCRAAADATGDGIVNVNDAIRILNVLIDAEPIPVDCESED